MKIQRSMLFAATVFILILLASYVGGQEPVLKLKAVETERDCHEIRDYICGKDVYKDYDHMGLPSNFGVKKQADLVITTGDIKGIKVTCRQYGKFDSWELHLTFNESGAKAIQIYTTANLRKRVALEVGGKIVDVPTILEKITTELVLSSTKTNIENLAKVLIRIYPTVTRETIIEEPPNRPTEQGR